MDLKIGGIKVNPVNRYNAVQKTAKPSSVRQDSDKLDISGSNRLFSAALSAAKDMPEVRMEKVQAIKDSYEKGNYIVDGQKTAKKMLESV